MVYRNNAGRLGAGFISVCKHAGWVKNVVFMSRDDPVAIREGTYYKLQPHRTRLGIPWMTH